MSAAAHATERRYRLGCRCLPCRAAHATRNRRQRRTGHPLTAAAPARAHLAALRGAGLGRRQRAQLSGGPRRTTPAVLRGARRRIQAHTAAALLALELSSANLAPGALVSNWPARRCVRSLQLEGFSQAEIARRLGLRAGRLRLQAKGKIRVRSARRLQQLTEEIQDG